MDDNIKYSWNYALLLAEGPSERSLVPAPLYQLQEMVTNPEVLQRSQPSATLLKAVLLRG
jgi:hypothetical protein